MKTKIKRHSRSVISVILAVCMLISCMTVGLIATDAAKVTENSTVGWGSNDKFCYHIKTAGSDSWGDWVTPTLDATTGVATFTVGSDNSEIEFYLNFGGTVYHYHSSQPNFSSAGIHSTDGETRLAKTGDGTSDYKLTGVYADTYTVTMTSTVNNGEVNFKINGTKRPTWTVVGDNVSMFGTAWTPTLTTNDMSSSDNNLYTKTYTNVSLTAGDVIKYKVVKDHAWTTAYPSSDATKTVASTGVYNVTVTYNNTSHAVSMDLALAVIPTYTLTVGNDPTAEITATYGGNTAGEGQTIEGIPVGAAVSINVTVPEGKKCTAVTGTYNTSETVAATGGGSSWTLAMPGGNTTVTVATDNSTLRKVYFNNYYTRYSMITAYAWKGSADQSSITEEPLGDWPGQTMTRIPNTNTWEIDLYDDIQYIIFRGDDGYNTNNTNTVGGVANYHIAIPWGTYDNAPKYTAGPDKTNPTDDGEWGKYVARTNTYTVSDGATLNDPNLFKAINATFFDYYVDGEYNNGTPQWLTGIASDEYNMGDNWVYDPYKNYNAALSSYATSNTVTYPLYFGNLDKGNSHSDVSSYHNFYRNNNNSGMLNPNSSAVYGLAGNTLSNGAIQFASGEDMPMFDEDFLSGENSKGKALATILHSSSFPVRSGTNKTLYLVPSTPWTADGVWYAAVFRPTSGDDVWVKMTYNSTLGKYTASVPSSVDSSYQVIFAKMKSADTVTLKWDNKDDDTGPLAMPANSNVVATITAAGNNGTGATVAWSANNGTRTHDYYEYDSTGGRDNAFITDIDTVHKTANLDYYADSAQYVQSSSGKKGFFPFDYNNVIAADTYDVSTIYCDFSNATGGSSYWAYFYGNGESWVQMTNVSGNIYQVTNPKTYPNVIFVKSKNTNSGWDNKDKQTGNLTVPDGYSNKYTYTFYEDGADDAWGSTAGAVAIAPDGANGYTNGKHTAHDQGFGVKLEIPFTLGANGLNEDGSAQTFDFSGDDDLWVYVDGKLVLDLGGAHAATQGSINFATRKAYSKSVVAASNSDTTANGASREVDISSRIDNSPEKVNTVHTMTIYYMERGMFDSNLKFGFSFHAIPNLLTVDKKVRTANVNHGFFEVTANNGAKNSGNVAYLNDQDKPITQFEHTYQGDYTATDAGILHPSATLKKENFTITQGSNSAPRGENGSVTYTIKDASTTKTSSQLGSPGYTFDYTLYNDWDASFIGQYASEQGATPQSVTLKEVIPDDSLYRYDKSLNVTYISSNNATIDTDYTEGTDTYSFAMPASTNQGLDDIRVRARFTNQMKVHNLTIAKDLNANDPDTPFKIQVLFKFGDYNWTAYPLYCTVANESADKANGQLDENGYIELRKDHAVTIKGIPENAQIQIKEVLEGDALTNYAYNSTTLTGGADRVNTIPYGKQFTLGTDDVNAVVRNTIGALTVTHELKSDTDGFGVCYVSADVIDGSDPTITIREFPETTAPLEIPPSIIRSDSQNKLKITLRTEPSTAATVMDSFWEQITSNDLTVLNASNDLGLTAEVEPNLSNFSITITFEIKELFSDGEQTVSVMPFFSKLATWKFRMIFDVKSYRNLYNNMEYATATIPYSDAEWRLMSSTTSGADEGVGGATVSTIPDFEKDDDRTAFVNSHAPYENGFKETYTWNTKLAAKTNKESDMAVKMNSVTRIITYIVKAAEDGQSGVYVQFKLPYDAVRDATDAKNIEPQKNTDGDVVKLTEDKTFGEHNEAWRTGYKSHYTVGGNYVKAPEKILISGTKAEDNRVYKYFSYWVVSTMATDKTSSQVYTKCYSPEFNLTMYQDSIIRAVYENDEYKTPSQMALADDNTSAGGGTATITFMENSRTQWTAETNNKKISVTAGGNLPNNYDKGGDRIYTDFLISFTYQDIQLNNSTRTGLTPGLIVETVDSLPINNETDLPYTQTQAEYATAYNGSIPMSEITRFINAGPSVKSRDNFLKSEFTLSQLDNKNRLNYYYSLPNISHSTLEPTERKNKIYRAYSYLRNSEGAVVISQPVYFTIYDIASITNSADGERFGGQS